MLLLGAAPARADWEDPLPPIPPPPRLTQLPLPGASWISLTGGLRVIPQADLSASLASFGLALQSHQLLQPAAGAALLWRFAADWSVGTEFGYSPDRYWLTDGSAVVVQTLMIQAVLQWSPPLGWSRVEPYLSAGVGYFLSGVSRPGAFGQAGSAEADGNGEFAAVGVRVALTTKFGLTAEERYAFAYAPLGPLGNASVGGNTVAVGLYYVWRE